MISAESLILQQLRSLVRIEFDCVHGHEPGEILAFSGINQSKRLWSLSLVARVLGRLHETDSFLHLGSDLRANFLRFRLNGRFSSSRL